MTREEWTAFEKIEHEPNVQLAMRARCEEQGHDFEPGVVFGLGNSGWNSVSIRHYRQCKWCGEKR